ncbi:MAG: OmpH family outer membrane protein, partial [Myxococcota bacterium]
MLRLCVLVISLGLTLPAMAGGIAYVDFQSAVNDSTKGQSAQKRLEQMYAARKVEVDKQKAQLEKALTQYEQQKLILTDQARAQAEQTLMMQQQ